MAPWRPRSCSWQAPFAPIVKAAGLSDRVWGGDPSVSTERLSLTAQGNVRYRLKTPYRNGTTDVVFEPLDFIARLAALVPTPRVNLTRYPGVFAPNHRLREQITPAGHGRRKAETTDEPAPARHVSMTWAQRLKRVFKVDIETCEHTWTPPFAKRFLRVLFHRKRLQPYIRPVCAT